MRLQTGSKVCNAFIVDGFAFRSIGEKMADSSMYGASQKPGKKLSLE
jgi:hypothetical protein